MLQALLHSKHCLRYTEETNLFIEDSLTACVFGLFRYLPNELLEEIWTKALSGPDGQIPSGTMRECAFWPRWSYRDNPSSWCEPDVFCRFDTIDLIIEAKRFDCARQQYAQQWENELATYRHTYKKSNEKSLILFAVGGLGSGTKGFWRNQAVQLEQQYSCKIVFRSWSDLWLECINPVLSKTDLPQHVQNIREDLRISLRHFGITIAPPDPLSKFPSLVFPATLRFSEAAALFGATASSLEAAQAYGMRSFAVVAQKFQVKDVDWSTWR